MSVLRRICLLLVLLPASAGTEQRDLVPPPFSATYAADNGYFTVAETRVAFRRPAPRRYVYESRSHAVGVAAWFRDAEIRERSEGHISDHGLKPQRYEYRRAGNAARNAELRFHWDDGQVVNDIGDYPWRMDIPPETKDRIVGSVQLMRDLASGEQSLSYPVADGGKLRTYQFEVRGETTITTALGRLETIKVVRTDSTDDSRTLLWTAPALHYLPVRIEHRNAEDGTYTMRIQTLEGLGATGEHR